MATQVSDSIDLQKYFRLAISRKWLFVIVGVAVYSLLTGYFEYKGPVYTAETEILVEDYDASSFVSFRELQPKKVNLSTRILLLQGDPVLREVVRNLDLTERFGVSEDTAVRLLSRMIAITEKGFRSNILVMTITCPERELAADIANEIVDVYIRQDMENLSSAFKEIQGLMKKKDQILESLDAGQSIDSFEEISSFLPSIDKDEIIRNLKQQRMKIKNELRDLEVMYKDKHPEIVSLNNLLESIRQEIQGRTKIVLSSITAGYEKGIMASQVNVVKRASLPEEPDSGKRIKMTILAMYVAMAGTFGLVIVKELRNQTVRTEEDIRSYLFLGYIPVDNRVGGRLEAPISHQELYSAIRSSLQFGKRESSLKLAFTSAFKGEGKTTIAYNVACAIARTGVKTILIDMDFRDLGLTKKSQVKVTRPHLADYLEEDIKPSDVQIKNLSKNMDILVSNSPNRMSSELLQYDKLQALIDHLSKDYQAILIDAPPVISGVEDAVAVARVVGSVVLTVHCGVTEKSALSYVNRKLSQAQIDIVGVIINYFQPPVWAKDNEHFKYYMMESSPGRRGAQKNASIKGIMNRLSVPESFWK